MQKIIIAQSDKELYTGHSGLALTVLLLNCHTSLEDKINSVVPGKPAISHFDVVKSYLALLTLGRSDYEAIANFKDDEWFKIALCLEDVPSRETLRQRFDAHTVGLSECVDTCSVEMLKNMRAKVTALKNGCIPLDIDVFPMDNSNTKKHA